MLVSISISTPLLFGCDYVSHTYRRDDQIRYNGSSRYYEPRNPLEKLNLGKKGRGGRGYRSTVNVLSSYHTVKMTSCFFLLAAVIHPLIQTKQGKEVGQCNKIIVAGGSA